MLVHVFGAYFGLAVSFVLRRDHSSDNEGPSYTSDTFAMIGNVENCVGFQMECIFKHSRR